MKGVLSHDMDSEGFLILIISRRWSGTGAGILGALEDILLAVAGRQTTALPSGRDYTVELEIAAATVVTV